MNPKNMLTMAAVAGALTVAATSAGHAMEAGMEKCAGVAKAGKNDCAFGKNSCAGSAVKDHQEGAWIAVPAGTCAKIAGGKVVAMDAMKGNM